MQYFRPQALTASYYFLTEVSNVGPVFNLAYKSHLSTLLGTEYRSDAVNHNLTNKM